MDPPSTIPSPTQKTVVDIDIDNVQGDILFGFNKNAELFYFFQIKKSKTRSFGEGLAKLISEPLKVEKVIALYGAIGKLDANDPTYEQQLKAWKGEFGNDLVEIFQERHKSTEAQAGHELPKGKAGVELATGQVGDRLAEALANFICGGANKSFSDRLSAEKFVGTEIDLEDRVKCLEELLTRYIPGIAHGAQIRSMREKNREFKNSITILPDLPPSSKSQELRDACATNIAFSSVGLKKLLITKHTTHLGGLDWDAPFMNGQEKSAGILGDDIKNSWDKEFKGRQIDGVILIAGSDKAAVEKRLEDIRVYFDDSSIEIMSLLGQVRPKPFRGFEHFGWNDYISQPRIEECHDTRKGPDFVDPGIILLGHEGDVYHKKRQGVLEKEGSFLVFRRLSQQVPEFHEFLRRHPIETLGLSKKDGSELLGARLVGRWKNGAPVNMTPFRDYAELMTDRNRNNNFSYAAEDEFQKICPFASHIRKVNPRTNTHGALKSDVHRIMRRGIPFGDEVTKEEEDNKETKRDRGLLFVSYQANIQRGFMKQQADWANNVIFPPRAPYDQLPGVDALIGQHPYGGNLTGSHPDYPCNTLDVPTVVVSHGGEFFFSPSLKALQHIAKQA